MAVIIMQIATESYFGPGSCTCVNKWMRCYGTFPTAIPREVTYVELLEIESDIFIDGVFCRTSWNNVRNLTITCLVKCSQKFIMKHNTFRCFKNLKALSCCLID